MTRIVLHDIPELREQLMPLTLTRPISYILTGCYTGLQRWQKIHENTNIEISVSGHLEAHYHTAINEGPAIVVNSTWLNGAMDSNIPNLSIGDRIVHNDMTLAIYVDNYDGSWKETIDGGRSLPPTEEPILVTRTEQLTKCNRYFLNNDIPPKADKTNLPQHPGLHLIGSHSQLHIADGAHLPYCVINVTDGPVYIDKNATIMEGAMLRGPLYVGQGAAIHMGAKIYGGTSIGRRCKIGGEVKRSIFFDYSNKGHDGFVGDSVIGSWCNIGADSNTSNMKNTYGTIKAWDIATAKPRDTGEQFIGLVMGDHAKCGINTQFNAGTVVGTFANIYDTRPYSYIPPFAWGAQERYDIDKAVHVAKIVYGRRDKELSTTEEGILRHIYENYV